MENAVGLVEQSDPWLSRLNNAGTILYGGFVFVSATVAYVVAYPLFAAFVATALGLLGFCFVRLKSNDYFQKFLNALHPNKHSQAHRNKARQDHNLEKFRQRALCGEHAVTTDGRVVSHVGNPTGSFTTPNGPRSRNGERVIFVCNYCHAAGELVRLADGRQGLLHRATDGPVEVVAVHPEPTAFGK